jgi:sugar (pentulose or hexulose) kinase
MGSNKKAVSLNNSPSGDGGRTPVIAIFDIGKTNKKLFLFDEKYNKVFEESIQLKETLDEDGDTCEDLALLTEWVRDSFKKLLLLPDFEIKAVNFSAYGASFVHIMQEGAILLPLYNYLKPYPKKLQDEFYATYGGELKIAKETASPVSGNLNSGLQLYRIKKQQPAIFETILTSLHLPQYLSFLITHQQFSDITSIGCHTSLWDFEKNKYHDWVYKECIDKKLSPVKKAYETVAIFFEEQKIIAGIGLHDSSAALIPYLLNFSEPFILISTGTWCISLNPYNNTPLTEEELSNDCLCYIQYKGLPVKANRLFAGYEHEQQVKKIGSYFSKSADYYKQVTYEEIIVRKLNQQKSFSVNGNQFAPLFIDSFDSYEEAYHQLMINIIERQVLSTKMILKGTDGKRIFVDGGFSKNSIYMNLMAQAFPAIEVFAASMAQATAMGAALAIHQKWNSHPIPGDLIELKMYTVPKEVNENIF